MSLGRRFSLAGSSRVQVKADAFNVLNHPNFADPDGNLSGGTFGLSTQTLGRSLGTGGQGGGLNPLYQIGGPRSIQLSLKLEF
jgi:hypothetical protein